MNIRDLEAFIAVVETGSIVGASARLHLTQPGVTRRIQNLEEALGATLLDRQSKPLRPTAEGRAAYAHGRQVLASLEDMKAIVSPEGEVEGEFRIGIMPNLSEAALTIPLDRLRGEFPRLSLHTTLAWSQSLLEQLGRNEVDAAAVCLADGVSPPPELGADDLGAQPVLVIASRKLGIPKPATLEDLSRFPWIMSTSGCGYRTFIRHRFETARLPFQVAVEALSSDLRLSLVARGVGIGIITPSALFESHLRDEIEVVETVDFNPQGRAWVLYRAPAGRLAGPVAVFREALAEALGEPMQLSA